MNFAIILTDLNEPAIIERLAQKMLESLCQPFRLEDDVAMCRGIGISLYPHDSARFEELFETCRSGAMYAAKHLGRNCYSYFTPALSGSCAATHTHGWDLRVALSENNSACITSLL